MKRKVAFRRLKRTCIKCNCTFLKGDVYYIDRNVYADEFGVFAHEYLMCSRCRHKKRDREERFERFKKICWHPITHTVWSYIPGEAVMEPDYEKCSICEKIV